MMFGMWQSVSLPYFITMHFKPYHSNNTHTTALKKKLDSLSKEKNCELVKDWKKSLINHLYWSAVSTPSGDGESIKAKWISLHNHIHNMHHGHSKLQTISKMWTQNLEKTREEKKSGLSHVRKLMHDFQHYFLVLL